MNNLIPATWRVGLGMMIVACGLTIVTVNLSRAETTDTNTKRIECVGLNGPGEEACKAKSKALRKAERRSTKIQVKAVKERQMTSDQLESLQDRVDEARAKGTDAKVKTLAQKFEQKRKELKADWKIALETKNLSKAEKKSLRLAAKMIRDDLKALNEELHNSTEKSLLRDIAPTELQALQSVEPNYLYELQGVNFNDPAWSSQWGLQSVGLSVVPIPEGVSLQAHEPIIVALVDSGVNFSHADLNGNMWTDPNCVDADGLSIPGGCMSGGYDFVDNDSDPYPADSIAHGTSVASVLGAVSNNNTDLASAAGDRIKIMAVRSCCTAEGLFEADSIAEGIYFAVNNGAKIINASFGGPTPSMQIRAALQYAAEHEVLVVSAAGNYASNNDQTPIYPANYNQELPNILSVAATTSWDYLAYFSNYGSQTVDLAAPGQDIIAAGLNFGTVAMSGTSFSTPMTASVLAKWWQQNPQLTLGQLKQDFLSALVSLSPIMAQVQGGKALRFALPDPVTDPVPTDPEQPVGPAPTDPVDPTDPIDPIPPTDPVDPVDPDPKDETNCKILKGDAAKECRAQEKERRDVAKFEKEKAKCLAMKKEKEQTKCLKKMGLVPGGTTSDIYTYSASGDWSFHHADHLSSTGVDTDNTGQVIQLYDYYPFGDVRIDNHATGYENDYQFTGKERDDATDLLYYEARYYNSALSRFISLDPWEGDLNDPQSFNQTAYVRNNPLKYVDPSGEVFQLVPMILGAALAYGAVDNGVVGFAENLPGIGDLNDVYSAMTGTSAISGESVSGMGRVAAAMTLFPGVSKGTTELGSEIVQSVADRVRKSFELPTDNEISGYTRHGRERALIRNGRGVDPKAMSDAAKNPIQTIKQDGGATKFVGASATTVLNKDRKVITTYGKPRHDKASSKSNRKQQANSKNNE